MKKTKPKPKARDFGYVENRSFDEPPSYWSIKGGDAKFRRALKKWCHDNGQEFKESDIPAGYLIGSAPLDGLPF